MVRIELRDQRTAWMTPDGVWSSADPELEREARRRWPAALAEVAVMDPDRLLAGAEELAAALGGMLDATGWVSPTPPAVPRGWEY